MDGRSPSPRNSFMDMYVSGKQAMIRRKEGDDSWLQNHPRQSSVKIHKRDDYPPIVGRLFAKRNMPEIVGSSGHEKVPTRGKPGLVWSDQEDHEERGSKDRATSTCEPVTVTRSTIRADVGVAIVPQTISRHLAEANLKSKRPFLALPVTPNIGNCVYSGAKPDQCGMSQIGKMLCLVMNPGLFWGR
ncbi:HTH_Tnp_Tc3_2 domain-containing protein [Trichonephila clavipes]|nr:HTH_Tnp_Tc3_2 domain-containing protein [Trichonephila clavipes]